MNDDELISAMKERFAEVHLNIPLGAIARRRRTLRARRQFFGTAGVTALAGAAALAVAGQLPGGGATTPSAGPSASLAAWSVAEQADGTVRVTIRDLQNPDGLQSELRADGIPANVQFYANWLDWGWTPGPDAQGQMPPLPASCTRYDASRVLGRVFPDQSSDTTLVFTIDPSAIPDGAGVALQAAITEDVQEFLGIKSLVEASPQCTGS